MKNIVLIFILLVSTLFSDINWLDEDEVYSIAKKENKLVMVMLSRENCPGCEYMLETVFKNEKLQSYLAKHFLSVQIDVNENFVPDELPFFGTPTFYFLDMNATVIKRINGGEQADKFLKTLEEVNK